VVTAPDPAVALFLALHHQNENCHADGKVEFGMAADADGRDEVLARAGRLLEGLRRAGVPIVHVRLAVRPDYRGVVANTPIFRQWIAAGAFEEGGWGVEFHAGLGPVGDEIVVTHTRNSAFGSSDLAAVLAHLRPRHLICAGVSTAYVVESTVRQATDLGYETWVVADACATATEAPHDASLRAMELRATIATTDALLAALGA
jgi:nicotinamidase-related amidase